MKQAPVDVIFLVDGSGSLFSNKEINCQPDKFRYQLDFVLDVIDELKIGADQSRVGFIQFTTNIDEEQKITLSESVSFGKSGLKSHVNGVEWGSLPQYNSLPPYDKCSPKLGVIGSQTNTPKGMQVALEMFLKNPRPVPKLLFVMTDGFIDPTTERSKAYPAAKLLLGKGVDVFAVGIKPTSISEENKERMQEDLLNIAGRREDRVFETDDFDTLKKEVLDSVLNAVNCK